MARLRRLHHTARIHVSETAGGTSGFSDRHVPPPAGLAGLQKAAWRLSRENSTGPEKPAYRLIGRRFCRPVIHYDGQVDGWMVGVVTIDGDCSPIAWLVSDTARPELRDSSATTGGLMK